MGPGSAYGHAWRRSTGVTVAGSGPGPCRLARVTKPGTERRCARLQEPKTSSSRRTIALDDPCVATLREHRNRQMVQRLKMGPLWQGQDLVFATDLGTPLLSLKRQSPLCRAHHQGWRAAHTLPWDATHARNRADEARRQS